MARQARQISKTGLYHIIFRGVNHCNLFEEYEDFEKMLDLLATVKSNFGYKLHAYCLMSNHVHLFIQERLPGDIALIMKRVLGTYAYWFNKKYSRSGALIANRYKSTCVEKDEYLLTLTRYIHQNPLNAGIVKELEKYRWSSYCDYIKKDRASLADTSYILGFFSSDSEDALKGFKTFHNILESDEFSIPDGKKKSDEELRKEILAALKGKGLHHLDGLPKKERDVVLSALHQNGFSIRQIERATGISRGVVSKSTRNYERKGASSKE